MGIGIVIVEKELNGEVFSNSYPFQAGDAGLLSNANIESILPVGQTFTEQNTRFNGAGYPVDGATLAQAVVAFDRGISFRTVQYRRVYITDGQENSAPSDVGPLSSVFAVFPLNFTGVRFLTDASVLDEQLAPGNVALMVNRQPLQFSQRAGRIYVRGTLLDSEVRFAGTRGLDWTNATVQSAYGSYFQQVMTASRLEAYFGDGEGAFLPGSGTFTGIGKRRKGVVVPPLDVGDLESVVKIATFVPFKPIGRQMQRGRRRTP